MDGSSECVVGVINAQRTHSTGHKIKVCSLLVSGEMSSADAGNAWLEAGLVDDNNPNVPATIHRRRAAEQVDSFPWCLLDHMHLLSIMGTFDEKG